MDKMMKKVSKGVDMAIDCFSMDEHSAEFIVKARKKYQHEFEISKIDDTYYLCWTCKKDDEVIIDITNGIPVKNIKEFKTNVLTEKEIDEKIFETDILAFSEGIIIFQEVLNVKYETMLMDVKLKLKERLLEIPVNDGAFREKHGLARDLGAEPKEVEPFLDELCERNVLSRKIQYKCPTCHDMTIASDELLQDMIVEDGCYECDNCCGLVNPDENKTGYVFYDIKDKKGLLNWLVTREK